MASTPYMNQVLNTPGDKFAARDEDRNELAIEKTARGWTVTIDPPVDYPATFQMNFDTKTALIAWLATFE